MNGQTDQARCTISIIIPVYDDEAGLRACIEGIAKQSIAHERIEIIAVDNGSTPPLTVSADFALPVRILSCPKPGSYAARNVGAQAATGEVLAFTDADCSPAPDWLHRGVEHLLAGREQWLIGGEVRFHEPAVRSAVALYQYESGFDQRENIEARGFSATANLFCTRAQYRIIGPFHEGLLSGGDREWAWRATQKGMGIRFEPEALVYTHTRTGLAGAMRQARRVAAGRAMLRRLKLDHAGAGGLARHRSAWASIRWILSRPALNRRERLRVLAVAVLIRMTTWIERLRLAVGKPPERR